MSEWPTAEHVPAEKLALRQGVRPAPPSCSMITQLHRTRALADELITQHRGSRAPVGRFHRAGKERTSVVDIDALLPRARTPRHYLDLVADSRIDLEVLHQLARNPYPFVRLAVAKDTRTSAATLAELLSGEFDRWDRNHLLRLIAEHPRADRGVLLGVLIGHLFEAYGFSTQGFDVFLATGLTQGRPNREASERDMIHRFVTDAELRQMITSGEVVDAPSLAALTLYRL